MPSAEETASIQSHRPVFLHAAIARIKRLLRRNHSDSSKCSYCKQSFVRQELLQHHQEKSHPGWTVFSEPKIVPPIIQAVEDLGPENERQALSPSGVDFTTTAGVAHVDAPMSLVLEHKANALCSTSVNLPPVEGFRATGAAKVEVTDPSALADWPSTDLLALEAGWWETTQMMSEELGRWQFMRRLRRRSSTSSVAYSSHSQSSLASRATQASHESTDIFDQVLLSILVRIAKQISLLKANSTSMSQWKFWKGQGISRRDAAKELELFSARLRLYMGMGVRLQAPSQESLKTRHQFYAQLLRIRSHIFTNLEAMKMTKASKYLDVTNISTMRRAMATYDFHLMNMRVQMRGAFEDEVTYSADLRSTTFSE